MDKNQVIKIVMAYKAEVQKLLPNSQVYLYGSYSKDCAHKNSDIDVAVIVPELKGDWMETSSKLWGATWNVNTLIEPVLIEECHPSPLYEDIMTNGIAV